MSHESIAAAHIFAKDVSYEAEASPELADSQGHGPPKPL